MMTISSEQMEQIQREPDQQFVTALSRYLTERFSLDERPLFGAIALEKETMGVIAQARALGLPRYDGYALHAIASIVLGIDYHLVPYVAAVLRSDLISGELKALWLEQWLAAVESLSSRSA